MKEFHYECDQHMTKALKGRTIASIEIPDDQMDDLLIFNFTDGTTLKLHYDYIYSWELFEREDV